MKSDTIKTTEAARILGRRDLYTYSQRSDKITWRTCQKCDGAGKVQSIIESTRYTCGTCGGHGMLPDAPKDGARAAFYAPRGVYASERIALLHGDLESPERWRVTFFTASGPYSHQVGAPGEIMEHLRGYHISAAAVHMLDFWATRPAWAEGCDTAELIDTLNLFSWQKRRDLTEEVYKVDGKAAQLARARTLRRRHFPDAILFD